MSSASAKEESFYSMVKTVVSTFIQSYLPIPEDNKLDDTLKECWLEFSEDLKETRCFGEGGYLDGGVQKSFVSDKIWSISNDEELKKELLAYINSIFSFNFLKEINHFVVQFGDGHNYYLKTNLVLNCLGVSLDFSEDEEKTIPSIIEHKKYGSVDSVKMLHISAGNGDIDENSFVESYNNCVRYSLEFLEGEYSCPKEFELDLIHVCVNMDEPSKIKFFTKIEKSNTDDAKILDMVRQTLEDKLSSFMSVMERCIPKYKF